MKVVVGVDAHKMSHTLVAVDPAGLKLAQKTVATTSAAHAEAVRWAAAQFGSDILWAVEDCRTMTARLEDDLLAAGQRVIRVPPHLMSRTRSSARERGKSDPIDALAVARTVLSEPNLPVAVHDPMVSELPAEFSDVCVEKSIEGALERSDAAVVCTEWPEFRVANWRALVPRMRNRLVIDANRFLDMALGGIPDVEYASVGRMQR